MDDVTIAALHSALRGLSARRQAIATNISNVETPGYLAQRVRFEDALAGALDEVRRGAPDSAAGRVAPSTETSLNPTRLNGNNVHLDDEVVALTETDLAYQTALEAMNAKFRLLRTAIREGR